MSEETGYCTTCRGEGIIHTGIDEAPVTECSRCDGTGELPIPRATPPAMPKTTLRCWLDIIHDNELALGDRLQRLSSRIQSLLSGDAHDKYPPHTIREQGVPAMPSPRFIPDSECVQTKCANVTTGCRDACMMRNPPYLVVPSPPSGASAEQTDQTDISKRLRDSADAVMLQEDRTKLMRTAADECDRFYNGMMAWKQTAQKKDRDWRDEVTRAVDERCAARSAPPVAPSGAQEPAAYADPMAFLNFKIEREQNRGGPYTKEWMWAKPDAGLVPLYTTPPPAIGGPVQDDQELIAAAEAVIMRWYTPKWKDEQHTAVFIDRLRAALAAKTAPGRQEQAEPFAWVTSDRKHMIFADRFKNQDNPAIAGMSPLYLGSSLVAQEGASPAVEQAPSDQAILCEISFAYLPNEKRRIVIASDEVMDGERVLCIAIEEPRAEPDAQRDADEADKVRRQIAQGMADCMHMVRNDLIEMGIIDKSVAPMFIPEAVGAHIHGLRKSLAAEAGVPVVYWDKSVGGFYIEGSQIPDAVRQRSLPLFDLAHLATPVEKDPKVKP